MTREVFMILIGPTGSVFVKALDFFASQGGLHEDWGLNWKPIVATSIEDAREKACSWPGARPYAEQAKP